MVRKRPATIEKGSILNPKHRKFVEAYVSNGFKPQKAWVAAGYSAKTARVDCYKLLRRVDVQNYIRELMNPDLSREDAIATGRAVFQKLIDIAFFNLSDIIELTTGDEDSGYTDSEGHPVKEDKNLVQLRATLQDLPPHLSACLESIGNTESKRGRTLLSIKRIDPTFALRLLARFYAYDYNPDEILSRARSLGFELRDTVEGEGFEGNLDSDSEEINHRENEPSGDRLDP